MSSSPTTHRELEGRFIEHVGRLLDDPRLRLDTTRGRRPVIESTRSAAPGDKAIELKRVMSDLGKPDRALEAQMPTGRYLDVGFTQKKWFFFNEPIARLRATVVSPTKALVNGQTPEPMKLSEVNRIIAESPPPLGNVPTTLVICSTSGFAIEAREAAERRAQRTVVLVEPNPAGGWNVYGPPETQSLTELFDPEDEAKKRDRIAKEIEAAQYDLSNAGVAADKIAGRAALPIPFVETELKSYAKTHPGLVAKRMDGRLVLFRESVASITEAAGGSPMALIDSVKALFARRGESEKKIAFLSERRAALSQQRDRGYEEIGALEGKEAALREEFKNAAGEVTKRRVTSQLVQLHKDIERRQQLLSVLNQQINVVGTHLHNLTLVHQGETAKLPDSDEVASDAAAAEELLARLEADNELADSVGASASHGGLSAEEQAMYEQLSAESAPTPAVKTPSVSNPAATQAAPATPSPAESSPSTSAASRQRSAPEAG
jgi:hypothetical protein